MKMREKESEKGGWAIYEGEGRRGGRMLISID
jgi:hypothetical protein